MKSHKSNVEKLFPFAPVRNFWKPFVILATGILITLAATFHTKNIEEIAADREFQQVCNDIKSKIDTRLHKNALLIRSGAALFMASDSVTRFEWKEFCDRLKIDMNIPGIQGVGYAMIIGKNEFLRHVQRMHKQGFVQYSITPSGNRDVYTSIMYLEPFSCRNLRAFGYDMFSEPTHRKAMELSRDSDIAMLSGKVQLVQETDKDIQAGTLMYVPVYTIGMSITTIEQRRAAIKGWVYSPYRMNDLMRGILGRWDENSDERIQLLVYDECKSAESLLFDSQKNDTIRNNDVDSRVNTIPVDFNGKKWILCFNQPIKQNPLFTKSIIIVIIGGFLISILLFFLSLSFFNAHYRSFLLDRANAELVFQNEEKGKRAEELVIVNNELVFTISELNQFTYISNHDLQEPLRTMTTFSQMLHDEYQGKLDEDGNRYLEFIHNSALRMSRMVKDLFEYSLLGKESVKTLLDCNKIVDAVLSDLGDLIKQNNVKITVRELPVINGYETEMRLLFQNLIVNAIKFQKQDSSPEISISAERVEKHWLFSIRDNGIGIEETYREKIFIIFQRLHNRTEYGGTGIGLAHCKKITEMHGGKIWVESTPEIGSVFKFTIPDLMSSGEK